MRAVALTDAKEELRGLRPKGSEGGETKHDEIQAVRRACASMLITHAQTGARADAVSLQPLRTGDTPTRSMQQWEK